MNSETFKLLLDACQALTIIAAAITIIWQAIKKAKLPNETQNARLSRLEERMDKAYELFAKDKIRLDTFAEGERITQQAALFTGADNWTSRADEADQIPSIRFSDGPHGLRIERTAGFGFNESHPSTAYPTASLTACSFAFF